MKKILLLSVILLISIMPVNAETLQVQALSEFNTENPPASIEVKAVSDMDLDEELLIMDGYILKGNLVDVVSPKRLKRDATFSIVLTEYTDNNGQKHIISPDGKQFKGKFTTKFDYKHAAKTAALSVGNFFVKGLSLGYAAVEGAVKNEEGNRIKSSAHSVYENTPFSYVEKGQDILITKDQVFCLRFKVKDNTKEENPEELNISDKTDESSSQIQQEEPTKEILEEKQTPPKENNKEEAEDEDLSSLPMAPTPGEEQQYLMTIEALQSEVLGEDTSKNNKIALFGKKEEKETISTEKDETIKNSENTDEKQIQETESKILPLTQVEEVPQQAKQFGDELRPVSETKDMENQKITPALKEDNTEIKDNHTTFEQPQKNKNFFSKPKFKNSTPPAASGEIGDPEETDKTDIFAETESKQPQKSELEKEQKIKSPQGRELHTLKENPKTKQIETTSSNPEVTKEQPEPIKKEINTEISPATQSVSEPVNQTTETTQNREPESPVVTVADKHLKRRDFKTYESLVPELPAISTEPLAPLELPDTY